MQRRFKLPLFALALSLCAILFAYLAFTRVSAVMVLRWFVRENHIPIEVRTARWQMSFRDLLRGKIENLEFEATYLPLKLDLALQTPVEYVRRSSHWSIRLKPTLKVGAFPAAQGTVQLQLDSKHDDVAEIKFDLHETKPLEVRSSQESLSIEKWGLQGDLRWNSKSSASQARWSSEHELKLTGVKFARLNDVASIKNIEFKNRVDWPESPPLPLKMTSDATISEILVISGGFLADEKQIKANASFAFDGADITDANLSIAKPIFVSLNGDYREGKLHAKYDISAALNELLDKRLSSWLSAIVPDLSNTKSSGTLRLTGKADGPLSNEIAVSANLNLDAKRVELPQRRLTVENLKLDTPLTHPEDSEWGLLSIKTIDYLSIKLKNLKLYPRVGPKCIDLSTEDPGGIDHPIRQFVWGGAIDIAGLFAHLDANAPEFTASVIGGPFQLEEIQKDLCLLPERPIKGSVSFTYPQIVQNQDSLRLVGDLNFALFGGAAHIGDLNLFTKAKNPRLAFELDWSDLDLAAIGEWTHFGDMRGSLSGSLLKANFALTPYGPVPLSYAFTVKGEERAGKKVRFYGRAVENVMELLGSRKAEMPWYAAKILDITMLLRNWLPAQVDYMGFKAVSENGWTELTTFDPPSSKKHYLLYGSAFTIPLNTHDVYPARMQTDAFQGWLWGMIEYFKGRMKDEKQDPAKSTCKPLW